MDRSKGRRLFSAVPHALPGAAEVLEDEAAQAAVVGGALAAEHEEARAAELDPVPEIELGAGAVEQGSVEALGVAQAVEEVEEREADAGGEGERDGVQLHAQAVLRGGVGGDHQGGADGGAQRERVAADLQGEWAVLEFQVSAVEVEDRVGLAAGNSVGEVRGAAREAQAGGGGEHRSEA